MADYLKQFNTTAEYNTYINGTPDLPNVSLTLDNNEVHYNKKPDYSKEYLTFEALANGTFSLFSPAGIDSTKMTSVSYSLDNGETWVDTAITNTDQTITTPTVTSGNKVLWKGVGTAINNSSNQMPIFRSTANCNISGNIMSLLYGDNFVGQTVLTANYVFNGLFKKYYDNGAKVVSAENLVLPATTLTNSCYNFMFNGCTTLTTAPELPATTLTNSCYNFMFQGCRALNNITMLATNISANECLYSWVEGVAANGTFTKAASMTTLPTGTSGIPENWTVVDA